MPFCPARPVLAVLLFCYFPSHSLIQSTLSSTHSWTVQDNMLAVLFILGALYPLNFAEIPIRLLDTSDGVLSGRFPNAFLLSPPNCTNYANQNVALLYTEMPSNENKTETFLVPPCDSKQQWFLLQNLKQGTTYVMRYQTANDASANLTQATTSATDYQQIDSGLKARSGAMVVITVILSLAMVILLVGLIVSVFFSG